MKFFSPFVALLVFIFLSTGGGQFPTNGQSRAAPLFVLTDPSTILSKINGNIIFSLKKKRHH